MSVPIEPASGPQPVLAPAGAGAAASSLAASLLTDEHDIASSVEQVVELLSSRPGVDGVTVAMTRTNPERAEGWVPLGERAWLREWTAPGATCSVAPREGAGPDEALSLPWISQRARRDVVAVADTEELPPEAATDRRELARCDVRALITHSVVRDNTLYGSVAIARQTPGPWPGEYVADVRLLSAVLASRMAEEVSRLALVEAINRADSAHESKEHFFAAIGHELRTPITAVLGMAEVLGEDAQERAGTDTTGFAASVAHDAAIVLRAAEQLHAVVEDLLGTGDELGGGAETQPVDVADALADVVHWLRTPALASGVTVDAAVPPGTVVRTTPAALRQILTNLVGNAITHHREGGTVQVTASREVDELGRPRVRIGVRDDGPGLTEEQQREVFRPFVRYAGPGVRGTGLGLPLSRSLAERDGGFLGVESTPGVGSVFWVDLAAAGSDS